uniref:Uncharacterized protein n=1 Tax=Anguilla anguilla TaxID=7936 RepID=A0A0E9SN43_ANGAN
MERTVKSTPCSFRSTCNRNFISEIIHGKHDEK